MMSKNGSTPTLPAEPTLQEKAEAMYQKEHGDVHDLTARTPDYKAQMKKRKAELQAEFEAGQKMLGDLHTKEDELKATLLRISGAIQVLKELTNEKEEGLP